MARRDPALAGPVTAALGLLGTIYARLKGDLSVLYASRENLLLPVDLVHEPTGTVIAVDESPHFTSFRLTALELYGADVTVGFNLDEHKELCRAWCSRTDGLARGLAAKGFGFGGVQRERAYHDALFDLADSGHGPPADRPDRGRGRRRGSRVPLPPGVAARAGRLLTQRAGASYPSSTATLTVEHRPQRTRTFFVICTGCIAVARTFPQTTQT